MRSEVMEGNVFDTLPTLAPRSVNCCVTSPPYWMLRSYLPKGHALKPLELGSEPTPAEYVANMVRVFRLVRDALADHGTVWLNVGDTYLHDSRGGRSSGKHSEWHGTEDEHGKVDTTNGYARGQLALIPQRLMLALQADGWIVRSVVIWHKPAPMPASLTGWRCVRCRVKVKSTNGQQHRRSHGQDIRESENTLWSDCSGCPKCQPHGGYVLRRGSWRPTSSYEPVIMLAKTSSYYCDGDAVKTPPAQATVDRDKYTRILDDPDEQFAVAHDHETLCDNGVNLRDVWTIGAEPLKEKHYAAFPTELVTRCLKAGTSQRGYCPTCGAPWCRVVDVKSVPHPGPRSEAAAVERFGGTGKLATGNQANGSASLAPEIETLGWRSTCACPAHEPIPGRVLDPFAGSGRTLIAARRLGLDAVGCELNPQYVEMARRLIRDDMPLFAESPA